MFVEKVDWRVCGMVLSERERGLNSIAEINPTTAKSLSRCY